jgi:hypothetical protein
MEGDADIALRQAVASGPTPDIAEHLPVQGADKIIGEQRLRVAVPALRPCHGCSDVRGFGLVEIAAMGDPGLDEIGAFLWPKRRRVLRLGEEIRHAGPQRSRSRMISRI